MSPAIIKIYLDPVCSSHMLLWAIPIYPSTWTAEHPLCWINSNDLDEETKWSLKFLIFFYASSAAIAEKAKEITLSVQSGVRETHSCVI